MLALISFLNHTLGSNSVFLSIELLSLCCKLFLLTALIILNFRKPLVNRFFYLLVLILIASIFHDLSWSIALVRRVFIPDLNIFILYLFCRIGWIAFVAQNQLLVFFLENLIAKKFSFTKLNYFFLTLSSCQALVYLYLICFNSTVLLAHSTLLFEQALVRFSSLLAVPLFIPVLYKIITISKTTPLPAILKQQIKILLIFFIVPYLLLEAITNKLLMASFISNYIGIDSNTLLSISTLLITAGLFYTCRKIMGLRFLNASPHVQADTKFNFIDDFQIILEQLAHVTSVKELAHITQTFFKLAFSVPFAKARLYLRPENNKTEFHETDTTKKVDEFIALYCGAGHYPGNYLRKTRLFIKDELAVSHFYDAQSDRKIIIDFLDALNADIFLPIFERDSITAYIIVDQQARPGQLYSSIEQDEMLVFSSYLSNIITILKHGNLEIFLKDEKELQEELYFKHQEINIYKESIRSFLRSSQERCIGVILYKAKRFTYANQAAKEIIQTDLNAGQSDELTQACKNLARDVLDFRAPATVTAYDTKKNRVLLSGLPGIDFNSVIILAYYPEISDIIKQQIDQLKNPACWDYLLYLKTTHAGHLVSNFIPGTEPTLLHFKIELLKAALSKKTLLIEAHEDDLLATVNILHEISMRQGMHVLKLVTPEKNHEASIQIFGSSTEPIMPLLQHFNTGTLFIQNVHFLSIEAQNRLADFIVYGYYQQLASEHKLFSKARIICSSTQDIQMLAHEGLFSMQLCQALKTCVLRIPSLITLADNELYSLADGFAAQEFKNLLQLTEKDREKIADQRPASIQELREKVHQLATQKTARYHYAAQELENNMHDPEVMHAIRLGKKALQDPQIMQLLWEKFKNQTKIALVLGVNKSSVNRRFKDHNLTEN